MMKFLKYKLTIGLILTVLAFGLVSISKPQIQAQRVHSVASSAPLDVQPMMNATPPQQPPSDWELAKQVAKAALRGAATAAAGALVSWLISVQSQTTSTYPPTALDL